LQWVSRWLAGLHLFDTATTSEPWTLARLTHLFHPLTHSASPEELFLNVAHCCYRRCLQLTKGIVP
ncbi:hypothetical protein NDU88_003653, partial [Pleurodeles waltl]